jgi:hypothetical protein
MIRTQISLDRDMYRRARQEAKRQGISFAELVRRALVHVLTKRPVDEPWMHLAGAIEDAGADGSASVDAVVYGRPRP